MSIESYPFLKISRKYHVDYADVLAIADHLQHDPYTDKGTIGRSARYSALQAGIVSDVYDEIVSACVVQMAVRNGVLDWKTGKPVAFDGGPVL